MLRNLFIRLARLGLWVFHLHPPWVGGGAALFLLAALGLAIAFRRQLNRAAPWLTKLRPVSEHLFQIACAAIFLLLFVDFFDEAMSSSPHLGVLGGLATTLLLLALGAQYGQHLFARLKKLGPLELFEKEAPELIERLREVLDPLDVEIDQALGTPLSPAAVYAYQSANALIRYIEFSGPELSSERNKKRFGDLLFKFSQLALKREDWWAARWTLERLRNAVGHDFESFKVVYNLGMAYLQCAASSRKPAELRAALACFAEAAKLSPFDADSYFWMAYVQDELGMLDLAILNNGEVLKRRHSYAPAKYNIAISRIKKGEMAQALADLLAIQAQDEQGLDTLQKASEDEELRPLLKDAAHGSQARWWLEYHQDPTQFPG